MKNAGAVPEKRHPESFQSSDDMKPFSIAAFLQQARQYTPRTRQIRALAHTPAQAAPGEVWLTKAPGTADGEPEEPLTVLLLERFEGDAGEPTLFTGAPIFSDPRMAGPADAVLPREILGFEAGIAFASAASLISETLVACEGALPEVWTSRLAAFYGYVRGVAKNPPPGVTTGAPYIDENDPAFVFHEDLAEQMQALANRALEWATGATAIEVPGWFEELVKTVRDVTETVSERWKECAFPVPLPMPGLGMGALGGASSSILGFIGWGAAMAVRGLVSGAAPSAGRPLCQLAVGDTGATVLLGQCQIPAGAFGLEVLADPNSRLQGANVLNAEGQVVATIAGGKCATPFSLEGNLLLLRLSDGTLAPLKEVASLTKFQTSAEGIEEGSDAPDETPEVGDFDIRSTQNQVPDSSEEKEAYAASTEEAPPLDNLSADDLLPGFQGEAERDSDTPSEASVLRLAFYGPESPRPAEVPTGGVTAEWPGGQNGPHDFEYRAGAWWAQIRLNLPWPRTVVLLQEKKIRIKPVP